MKEVKRDWQLLKVMREIRDQNQNEILERKAKELRERRKQEQDILMKDAQRLHRNLSRRGIKIIHGEQQEVYHCEDCYNTLTLKQFTETRCNSNSRSIFVQDYSDISVRVR